VGNGDVFCLPAEILVFICCFPEIKARDLVALDGTCSRFHQKDCAEDEFSSITEQAAMIKINDPRLFSEVKLTLPFNLKGLYHFTKERRNLPVFSCAICSWRVGGFRCQGKRPPHLVREWEVDENMDVENTEETEENTEETQENVEKQQEAKKGEGRRGRSSSGTNTNWLWNLSCLG
jgi:hypothetical protein